MYSAGLVAYADLDERAIDALREFNEEGALSVLQQFKESDLSHVQVSPSVVFEPFRCKANRFNRFRDALQNKSAFLCGVMKTYRQREKQGSKIQESTKGPDESKIKVSCSCGLWGGGGSQRWRITCPRVAFCLVSH